MAKALSDRYVAADEAQMRSLLAEDRGLDRIVLCCLTTGNRDTLEATLRSASAELRGPIGRRLLLVDQQRTRIERRGWDVVAMGQSRGYAVAMGRGVEHAVGSGQPWIVWLEDDFTFNQRIDLRRMQRTMTEYPDLAQLVLLRQPWYPPEIEAGGIIGAKPHETYAQRDGHVVHRNFWSMNPMLTRRETLAQFPWPQLPGSEARFGRRILADPGAKVAFWGKIGDPPRVTHIGEDKVGIRY